VLNKVKRAFYRERVREISSIEPWGLFKWAKKQEKGKEVATIPTLRDTNGRLAISIEDKASLLRETAFPKPIEADLHDITNYIYAKPLEMEDKLDTSEIYRACLRTKPDKAPGPDNIPNRVIHILAKNRITLLKRLFQACWNISYHPKAFHNAKTVFIPKEGKSDYSNPSAYRPIALLNTLGKSLESLIAARLAKTAEKFNLIPNSQFGGRPNRSIKTALLTLSEKIKAI
jgi:hypothetical protein